MYVECDPRVTLAVPTFLRYSSLASSPKAKRNSCTVGCAPLTQAANRPQILKLYNS